MKALRNMVQLMPGLQQTRLTGWAPRYGLALVCVAAAMGLRMLLEMQAGPGLPAYITFYPAVMVVAILAGFGPGMAATVLAGSIVTYWILPPSGEFTIASPVDRIGMVIFLSMGLFMSWVADLYRRSRDKLIAYERETLLRENREILRRQAELVDPARAEVIAREMQSVVLNRGGATALPQPVASATLRRLTDIAGLVVAGLGLFRLAGWWFGLDPLQHVFSGLSAMAAHAALCFLLAGVTLWLRERRAVRWFGAGLIGAVAGLTLAIHLTAGQSALDALWLRCMRDPHALQPGHMAESTLCGFILTSLSLLLLKTRSRATLWLQQALALGVALIGMVALTGYSFQLLPLYHFGTGNGMALLTALAFFVLAAGLLTARPDGMVAMFAGTGPGAQLARRLMPVILVVPLVLGILIECGVRRHWLDEGAVAALLALIMTWALTALVAWNSHALTRNDAVRRATETQLRNLTEVMNRAHEPMIVREWDGTIRAWNLGAELLYGWTAAEALGQNKRALLHTAQHTAEEIDRSLARTGHWEGELLQIARDGRHLTVESRQTAKPSVEGWIFVLESHLDITERQRTEMAMRESELRFRLATEATGVGIWEWNVLTNRIRWDQQMFRIYGITPTADSFVDYRDWSGAVAPEDLPEQERSLQQIVRQGGHNRRDFRITRRDNQQCRDIQAVDTVRRNAQGQIEWVIGTNLDITEHKQAEEALRESELRFRLANEATGVGIWERNVLTNRIRWDRQMFRIYGVAPTADGLVDYRDWSDAVMPEDLPEQERSLQQLTRQGGLNRRAFRIRRRDDQQCRDIQAVDTVRLNAQGQVEWVIGTNLDITEHKRIERNLRESEALYRSIGESIDYGVWVCAPDGRNTYASESFLRMVGITQEQCSNFGWGDVLHPDDAERTIRKWQECVRTGGNWDIEHRFHGSDGQWHHVLARGVPFRNDRGEVTGWAGINLDISRLKQAEDQLKASLAEKEVLLREIHHRVKNNLQVISSLVSLQAESLADDGLRKVFGDVCDRIRTIALVHEKLYQTGNLAQVNIADYATSLLLYLWHTYGTLADKVRLVLEIAPVVLPIETVVPFGLILNELAGNALKHAFPHGRGGEVTVGLACDPADDSLTLWVRDNGVGLTEAPPWRQARTLGLRLVRMLASQLQGTVATGSGPGTEFRITFTRKETHS